MSRKRRPRNRQSHQPETQLQRTTDGREIWDWSATEAGESPEYQVVLFEPHTPAGNALLGQALARIQTFLGQHPHELNAEHFLRSVAMALVSGSPTIRLALAVNLQSGIVFGHALATIETDGINRWLFVWQAEIDDPHVSKEVMEEFLALADAWGQEQGITQLLFATDREATALAREYGFTVSRVIMGREIPLTS